ASHRGQRRRLPAHREPRVEAALVAIGERARAARRGVLEPLVAPGVVATAEQHLEPRMGLQAHLAEDAGETLASAAVLVAGEGAVDVVELRAVLAADLAQIGAERRVGGPAAER